MLLSLSNAAMAQHVRSGSIISLTLTILQHRVGPRSVRRLSFTGTTVLVRVPHQSNLLFSYVVVDVTNGNTANGIKMQIYTCNTAILETSIKDLLLPLINVLLGLTMANVLISQKVI